MPRISRPFGVLYADPPWRFITYSDKGRGRAADNHYKTLTLAEIKAFPLPPLHDDCVLLLWVVDAHLLDALEVIKAWGFTYKTIGFTWVKNGKRDSLSYPIGLGHWTRTNPENCLLATRGKPPRKSRHVRLLVIEPRGSKHSEKPFIMHRHIEQLCYGPYCELFAREKVFGWTCYGDEL
jgi:N6-adenosine-specific RNA methylase IME4